MNRCKGCDKRIPKSRGGPERMWCSQRCRRQTSYGGTCETCGAVTDGSGGQAKAPRFCRDCYGAAHRFWTEETIIEAIQEYARRYGRPPRALDWNVAMARAEAHPDRLEEIEERSEEGLWPGASTVLDRFGSWNEAIAAAGFEPRAYGQHGAHVRKRLKVSA